MSLKVKICGITNLADARYCAGAGADYLGFIQYEKSPRYAAPKVAKEIIAWVYGPEPVGVFVNELAETVNEVAAGRRVCLRAASRERAARGLRRD